MYQILRKAVYKKKISVCLFLFIVCIASISQAQTTHRWTGSINNDWNTAGNWSPASIPDSTTPVSIPQALNVYPVISTADAQAASVNIGLNASLAMNGNFNLSISSGGTLNNRGLFNTSGSRGAVIFEGDGTIKGAVDFNNMTINGAVNFGKASTINDSLTINTNGSVINSSPIYGSSSTLIYSTGTILTTGWEWHGTTPAAGPGVPQNISIINSTTVQLRNSRGLSGTLRLSANSRLSINDHILILNGTVTGTGKIMGSGTSDLIVGGTGALGTLYFDESIDGETNALRNITINRDSSGAVTLANKLNLSETYTPLKGILTTNDTLVFRSYSTGSARIAAGSSAGGYIQGLAQVECYIPAKRTWRLLTAPVVNDTLHIRTAWQEGVNNTTLGYAQNLNPHPGYGTHISGDNNTANGFDLNTTANGSLRTWQKESQSWSTATPPTISTLINQYPAYLIFVRGSRAVNLSKGSLAKPDSTKLRATGILNTGDINEKFQGKTNDFIAVGNPYVSPVNLKTVLDSANHISGGIKFWLWDPKINTTGGYVVYDNGSITASHIYRNADEAKILQSGQAFWVQISRPSARITFHESDKSSEDMNVFGKSKPLAELHVNLANATGDTLADGTTVQFNTKYSALVDNFDAAKLWNFSENIALVRNEKTLSIELRPVPQSNDTLFYRLYLAQRPYTLQVFAQNLPAGMGSAWLVDNYLNTKTKINLSDTLLYSITPNPDTNSYRNRFMIVFSPNQSKSIVKENDAGNDNTTSSKESIHLYPNPVTTNETELSFNNMPKGIYEVSVYNSKGQKLKNRRIEHTGGNNIYALPLNPSFPSGIYAINILNQDSEKQIKLQLIISR